MNELIINDPDDANEKISETIEEPVLVINAIAVEKKGAKQN